MKKFNIAVVGAAKDTGADILNTLSERKFPINKIYALSSGNLIGKQVSCGSEVIDILPINSFDFSNVEIVFLMTNIEDISQYNGNIIIDSDYLDLHSTIPAIVPEVNLLQAKFTATANILANPCAIATMLSLVLKPLDNAAKINRVVISTYQSASGFGKAAMNELYNQTKNRYFPSESSSINGSEQIAFNILPKIGAFDATGAATEELRIIHELKQIIGKHLNITATCVRVPVFVGHSISVNIEFTSELSANLAEEILSEADGVSVLSLDNETNYITPVQVVGDESIYVARIRDDDSKKNSINLWLSGDNIRRGKALNAVQIAEELVNNCY
ncbi:MAG: aspartate-semialdehyde dehydrogenase [Rickettsiaceae bacterium]|nr:MAG: aspartate-semialdehyde dehydrogenase [Rickettsiaceae bacterium]